METLQVIIDILLVLSSLVLILLVLLHKAKGGGMSDLFGGGMSQSMGSSGVAEKNLNKITVIVALIWVTSIVILGLLIKIA